MARLQAQPEGTGPIFRNPASALACAAQLHGTRAALSCEKMTTVATIFLVVTGPGMSGRTHRSSIFLQDGRILSRTAFPGDQFVLRVHAPLCARHAKPGSFAHIQCAPHLPMRRPLSIMRANPQGEWIECLFKAVGTGTRELAKRSINDCLSVLGPIGNTFRAEQRYTRPLLLGGGVGIPPMIFLAEELKQSSDFQPMVIMGSEVPFPFSYRPSKFLLPGIPEGVIAAMPLLEDWDIPSRLASLQAYPGCYDGYLTDLGRIWIESVAEQDQGSICIFACGPEPMLRAAADLAREFSIPCQISMEEFMACATGGCAGCVVKVQSRNGPAMKRVCVDGPVFDARSIFTGQT
mgnify:CR=1 FL=1